MPWQADAFSLLLKCALTAPRVGMGTALDRTQLYRCVIPSLLSLASIAPESDPWLRFLLCFCSDMRHALFLCYLVRVVQAVWHVSVDTGVGGSICCCRVESHWNRELVCSVCRFAAPARAIVAQSGVRRRGRQIGQVRLLEVETCHSKCSDSAAGRTGLLR